MVLLLGLLLWAGIAFSHPPVRSADSDDLVQKGFAELQNKSVDAAASTFKRALEKTPCNVDASYGLSLAYKRTGRWKEAQAALNDSEKACQGDKKALRYLSQFHYSDEVYLTTVHDWVKNQADWFQAELVVLHHFGPDLNAGVSFADYQRNEHWDQQFGLSLGKRFDEKFSFDYQNYFVSDADFLAKQKHHLNLSYVFPTETVLSVGGRFDEYGSEWAKVGRYGLRQYHREFYGEYVLMHGHDNFGESVTTNIFDVGVEKDKFLFQLGYSHGDETLDPGGGSTFAGQLVESVFFNFRSYIRPTWGFILSGGPEFRDHDLFRTTVGASAFIKF